MSWYFILMKMCVITRVRNSKLFVISQVFLRYSAMSNSNGNVPKFSKSLDNTYSTSIMKESKKRSKTEKIA